MKRLFNFAHLKMHLPICVLMSVLLMIADGFVVHGPSGPLVSWQAGKLFHNLGPTTEKALSHLLMNLEQGTVSFSVSHIMVLILCISASGSALLLCCLIYCTSHNKDTVFRLQMFLVFCPNLIMFLAFVLWGVSEGSLNETVSCCALYFLRPLMLLWAAPYVNEFTGHIKTFIQNYSPDTEYIVFSAVFYSVLSKSAWDKSLNYIGFEVIILLFVIVLLFNLLYIIFLLVRLIGDSSQQIKAMLRALAFINYDVLPTLQFIFMFIAFGSARAELISVAVLPVFFTVARYSCDLCGEASSPSVRRSVWFIIMLLVSTVIVPFYIIALENEKDCVGWACTIVFLQLLWALIDFTRLFKWDIHRVVPVYVFGSVGVVLLNSVALMTELILKTVNGDGAVGDMRVVVFSSEFLFTFFLMILLVFEPWIKTCLQSCQRAINSRQTPAAESQNQGSQNAAESDEAPANESNRNQTAESHEMNQLLNQDHDAGRSDMTEENLPDSVVLQT